MLIDPAYVYIMASGRNGTLYTGATRDILRRAWEHRNGYIDGFTRRYGCRLLAWFEAHDGLEIALAREKQIKRWRREWKLRLIEERNPEWRDLYEELSL